MEKAEDKATVWPHIVRIADSEIAAHMVLQYLEAWPLDVCLELLGMCRDRLSPMSAAVEDIGRQHKQLSVLRDVLQVCPCFLLILLLSLSSEPGERSIQQVEDMAGLEKGIPRATFDCR